MEIVLFTYWDVTGIDAMCAFVPHGGHMQWGYLEIEDQHDNFLSIGRHVFSLLPLAWCILFRPLWILLPVAFYGSVSLVITQIFYSILYPFDVMGPLWCWANFATVLWFVAVPWCARWISKEVEESKWRWLFYGTQQIKKETVQMTAEHSHSVETSKNEVALGDIVFCI